jgi:hypothetical protein
MLNAMMVKHEASHGLQVAQFLESNLYQNPKYANSKR